MKRTRTHRKRRGGVSTSVGLTLQQLAVSLKSQDKTLTIDEAKKKAKGLLKASDTLQRAGGQKSSWLLTKVFGNFLGRNISKLLVSKKKEAEAIEMLSEYQQKDRAAERIPEKEYREIIKRLTNIETEIKALKIIKVPEPTTAKGTATKVAPNTKEMDDAHNAIQTLYPKFKKPQIDKMLEGVPEGLSTEEMVKYALQDPSQRVPKTEVPAAVDAASATLKEDEKINTDRHDRAKQEHEEAFRKDMQRQLDEIKEGLEDNNDMDSMWSKLFPKIGTILSRLGSILTKLGLIAIAVGVAKGAYDEYQNTQKDLDKKAKLVTGDKHATNDSVTQKAYAGDKTARAQLDKMDTTLLPNQHRMSKDPRFKGQDIQIDASGRPAAMRQDHPFKRMKDKVMEGWNDLTKSKSSAKVAPRKSAPVNVTPPKPKFLPRDSNGNIDHAAMKLQQVNADKEDLKSKKADAPLQPIILTQPSPTIVAPPAQDAPTVMLKTRNDESTYSAMVTDLFDHPQTHSAVRGL